LTNNERVNWSVLLHLI